ncbi:MAG: hypothetical protein ABFR90_02215 [Planctomycetota bacterium]
MDRMKTCSGRFNRPRLAMALFILLAAYPAFCPVVGAAVALSPAHSEAGFIARLLLNEAPFPGERGWVSEDDSKAAMLAILWVCHSRIHHIPPGYLQEHIATVRTQDIIDVITAGGEHGQVDGFYRDSEGRLRSVPRVQERLDYLLKIANQGRPGKFAHLVSYAQALADAYVAGAMSGADRYAGLTVIGRVPVTGRAYSWMTDMDYYSPGGNFVRITDDLDGSLGGNRFFTLRRLEK